MSKIQYQALTRVGNLIERVLITRTNGYQTNQEHIAWHSGDDVGEYEAILAMRKANATIYDRMY